MLAAFVLGPDRSSSLPGASMLVSRWRRTAPTAESRAAPIAQIRACAGWARHDCSYSRARSGRAIATPRPQSSRCGWRTAASARRCTSRAARGRRHPPRYCFSTASPTAPAGSDRPALADRVIAMRGKGSCRGRQPHYRIRFVSRDPAAIGLPRATRGRTLRANTGLEIDQCELSV